MNKTGGWKYIAAKAKLSNLEIMMMGDNENPGEKLYSELVNLNVRVVDLIEWLNDSKQESASRLLRPFLQCRPEIPNNYEEILELAQAHQEQEKQKDKFPLVIEEFLNST